MRIGQTSVVVFISRVASSLIGFLATLYFARVLGAEILGYYALTIALASWIQLGGNLGISGAIEKRISEGTDTKEFVGAGVLLIGIFVVLSGIGILISSNLINKYVGRNVAGFVVMLVTSGLGLSLVNSVLNGQKSVHISGLLNPVRELTRVSTQVALVFLSLGLGGLLIGQAVGWFIGIVIGAKYINIGFSRPAKEHLKSLYEYSKYSWIGNLKSRVFNDVDMLILGFFVPASLVGVYSVVWGITVMLMTFNKSISGTLFPEISQADAQGEPETVASLITDGIRYTGLLLIPGVVGGSILSDRLLLLYGPEFSQGTAVIGFLLLAVLLYGYAHQLLNSLNAIGRPDLTFRINITFITFNAVSNLVLIQIIGWIGAALTTMLSAAIGLILSFKSLQREVRFAVPKKEIFKQIIAAIIMGCIVYMGNGIENTYGIISQNTVTVLILVFAGALFYFATLIIISSKFRRTIHKNIPKNKYI